MINDVDFERMSVWLEGCIQPVLVSHARPDGDSLGSLAAVAYILKRIGAEPAAVLFDPIPTRYSYLTEIAKFYAWEDVRDVLSRQADGIVVLDTCSLAQLEPIMRYLGQAPRTLVVDHHATRDAIGARPGDMQVFDDTASATCLILAEWVKSVGIAMDAPLATALFTGIATDCGWFRHGNTDARTFNMSAALICAGVRPNELYRALYQQDPLGKLRLIARLLGSIELHADGLLAVLRLRSDDFKAAGADLTMTEDLVNEATRLAGCDTVILFIEEEGRVRATFRSKSQLDVAALASRYGGGGHMRAAGARLNGEWDRVVPRVISEAIEALVAGERGR